MINKISNTEYELCTAEQGHLYYSEKEAIEDQARKYTIESKFVSIPPGDTAILEKGFLLVERGVASIQGELTSGYRMPTIAVRLGVWHKVNPGDIISNLEDIDLVFLHMWYTDRGDL